ncbi:MAG: efflux RND transporter periplasmic adaptor subunit, partial [Planctomycetota bacterium]
SKRSTAVAVEVVSVKKETVRDIGFFTGSLLPKSYFIVAPKVAGRLLKLLVDIGDHIKCGQLIAVLDDEEYSQQVEQAQAALLAAETYLEKAKQSLLIAEREIVTEEKKALAVIESAEARYKDVQAKSERQKQLLEKKLVSEEEYETAATAAIQASSALDTAKMQIEALDTMKKALELKRKDVAVAETDVTQKTSALKAAQVRLSYTQIKATWGDKQGEQRVVGERFVAGGALLAPNNPIVSILDINSMTALIYVIERDYYKVKVGQEAVITTDALRGETFIGTVARIAPLLKETSRQARIEIEVANHKELLKPGLFIRVQIQFAEHKDVTVIPVTALVRRSNQQGIFSIETKNKAAHFIHVETGIFDGDYVEVLNPHLTGLVVTLGHHLLEDGSIVIIPEAESERPSSQQDKEKSSGDEESRSGGEK